MPVLSHFLSYNIILRILSRMCSRRDRGPRGKQEISGLGESSSDVLQIGFELLRRSMGDVDVGRGGPTVDGHDASLDLCPCPRASSMARGHVQEDELDRGNGVPRGMQRRCERAWPRSWCSAETIPFSIATAEAGSVLARCPRGLAQESFRCADRLLGLLAMMKCAYFFHSRTLTAIVDRWCGWKF